MNRIMTLKIVNSSVYPDCSAWFSRETRILSCRHVHSFYLPSCRGDKKKRDKTRPDKTKRFTREVNFLGIRPCHVAIFDNIVRFLMDTSASSSYQYETLLLLIESTVLMSVALLVVFFGVMT